jgi:hypothetical protein
MISRVAVVASWIVAAIACSATATWMTADRIGVDVKETVQPAGATSAPQTAIKAVPAVKFATPNAAIAELLGRSPFDVGRRQFQRGYVEAPPPVPPRLLGISSSDGARSALVEWKPSGETQRLTVGMQTPQGLVSRIGDSDFVLKNGNNEITISMFD